MTLSDLVTEVEYSGVLEGVKDLLKETYSIPDHEASKVMDHTLEKVDAYLYDYMPYLQFFREMQSSLRETLDGHLETAVDNEMELQLKMSNDAAIWLTFECIRHFCKKNI